MMRRKKGMMKKKNKVMSSGGNKEPVRSPSLKSTKSRSKPSPADMDTNMSWKSPPTNVDYGSTYANSQQYKGIVKSSTNQHSDSVMSLKNFSKGKGLSGSSNKSWDSRFAEKERKNDSDIRARSHPAKNKSKSTMVNAKDEDEIIAKSASSPPTISKTMKSTTKVDKSSPRASSSLKSERKNLKKTKETRGVRNLEVVQEILHETDYEYYESSLAQPVSFPFPVYLLRGANGLSHTPFCYFISLQTIYCPESLAEKPSMAPVPV